MEDVKTMEDIDVLVIGGGIAATYAAIKAKGKAKKVVQVDKGHTGKSGCSVTGAGILHVLLPQEDESTLADRLRRLSRAQGYLVQQDMIQDHLEQSWGIVQDMEEWGVEFERAAKGGIEPHPGRGAHPVILFHGPQLMHTLMKTGLKLGVQQINRVMITDLLTNGGKVVGAVGFDIRTGEFVVFKSKATVLATGSTWYRGLLPGHRDTTGDGYAVAYRAGATLRGGENNDMISHAMPARFDIGPGLTMYQALGGRWYNAKGERIMERYNPALKEQAGLRNIMYAFVLEVRRGNGPITIDMTHFTEEQVQRMRRVIPLPTRMFERAGLIMGDKFVQKIEWM
jgi:succinate dehydrogenase/fumarate reductase flavoprotein subunit